ncbi:MAG: phospholipase D-like domain-containing protein [Deltaproteobacteria bacterium]|jgi:superfamily II DNA or RNA helicase|nr:phospholipase D-like domain-containing protein [Deltaproteobacteria bacterium]
MPQIYDNIDNYFKDGLFKHLSNSKRVDYCVGYFNLRAWNMVSREIDQLIGEEIRENGKKIVRFCRLLVGMTKTPKEEIKEDFIDPEYLLMDNEKANRYRKLLAADFAEQLTCGFPTHNDERNLQTLLNQLKNGRVSIKLYLRHQLHAKLYIAYRNEDIASVISLIGSSNFTVAGLSKQGELNVDVLEQDATRKLSDWFSDRWLDKFCIDISQDLIEIIENSWARSELIKPYYIYLKIAYHLSQEARAGLAEYNISSEFSNDLLDFQQAAVKIAAHHLNKGHGVMIGDVVGLGKTITATAVAKILEDTQFYNTLITCPKNLVCMWESYSRKYELHASVIAHSMLNKKLPDLRRYKLVIIDESHNFRNNMTQAYRILKSYIEENECKVILLSATPYNKSYLDLSNQLKLFLPEDYDLGILPEKYINYLGGIVNFTSKHTDTNVRTINAFEKSFFPDDWREVMKLFLVRRTRSFIKINYAKTDLLTGRKYLEFASGDKSFFPDRSAKKVEFSLDQDDPLDQYALLYEDSVVDEINDLNLPRYMLQNYLINNVSISPTITESSILTNLARAGRSTIGFCRTRLFKRLESCGYSFLVSLSRHIVRNYIYLYALKEGLDIPVSGNSVSVDLYSDGDNEINTTENDNNSYYINFLLSEEIYYLKAREYYNIFKKDHSHQFQWIRSSLFNTTDLIHDLEYDIRKLMKILEKVRVWNPNNDRKIESLCNLLINTHRDEKVLIFTQYADTAKYIFRQLEEHKIDKVSLVVGGTDNVMDIISRFSPLSNGNERILNQEELRILVATDVLSEGQNLQDSHIIVNFDLPWALVRLIQRAGRLDRIGQESSVIYCYSFLPEDGIERILGLREKLITRISENADVVGSDEVFFEGDPVNISDLYSEKSDVYDEEDDVDVDLSSLAYQIWKNETDAHPDIKSFIENMPNVVFGAKKNDTDLNNGNGVIIYARTYENNDALVWMDSFGNIVTQSQYTILKASECQYDTLPMKKLSNHHELVAKSIKKIMADTHYNIGTLGRKNSVKYRCYKRLQRFCEDNSNMPSYPIALKYALDAIYRYPIKENAIDLITRQFKANISDDALAELIISLYESDRLCYKIDNDSDQKSTNIICSLSLIGGNR